MPKNRRKQEAANHMQTRLSLGDRMFRQSSSRLPGALRGQTPKSPENSPHSAIRGKTERRHEILSRMKNA